jgi:hypothetical protein
MKKLRRPRQNESLLSINGSPIANPFNFANDDDEEDDEDAQMTFAMTRNNSIAPRRMTVRDLHRMESLGGGLTIGDLSSSIINIPIQGGGAVLEIDPTLSPSTLKDLGENTRKEVADKLKSLQDQLSSLLKQIDP